MRTLAAMLVFTCCAAAQSFEVATVKLNQQPLSPPLSGGPDGPPPPPPPPLVVPSPTGVTLTGVTLQYCLQWAYNLKSWQVVGPDWISGQRYDIVAKTAAPV